MAVRQPSRRKDPIRHSHPKPPLTPNTGIPPSSMPQPVPNPLLPSAPASPPTPAPSPTPQSRIPLWNDTTEDYDDPILRDPRLFFSKLSLSAKEAWLAAIVDTFDNHLLNYVNQLVSPRLKKDPFITLPNELCFKVCYCCLRLELMLTRIKILEFVDDARTFARASQVSWRWREILGDDQVWKILCDKHAYRRNSNDFIVSPTFNNANQLVIEQPSPERSPTITFSRATTVPQTQASILIAAHQVRKLKRPRPRSTHRSYFKHRYLVESIWRKGGQMTARHITPDQGVVTSLHLTKKYIIVALDNAKIHVFNVKGDHQRTLTGHVMGVWAMVPWDDILVSGGCDRDVRVWNMDTGYVEDILEVVLRADN